MDGFAHPRVVVGVDGSLTSLAALRIAVAEARRRCAPLHAIRAGLTSVDRVDVADSQPGTTPPAPGPVLTRVAPVD